MNNIKGFAAILAVLIGMFGYAVVDKNYVEETENKIKYYKETISSLQNVSIDYSKHVCSTKASSTSVTTTIHTTTETSTDKPSNGETTTKTTPTSSTTFENTTITQPMKTVENIESFESIKVGDIIKVNFDDSKYYIGTILDGENTIDFYCEFEDAYARVTEKSSNEAIVIVYYTVKITRSLEPSSYKEPSNIVRICSKNTSVSYEELELEPLRFHAGFQTDEWVNNALLGHGTDTFTIGNDSKYKYPISLELSFVEW